MKTFRTAASIVALLAAVAPPAVSQVIAGPAGPVEFIGLQRWEAQELFDAIQDLAPDLPFHACANLMKQNLGFAEAAALRYRMDQSDDWYTVVSGVEDGTRIKYRSTGGESVVLPESWQELQAAIGDDYYTLAVVARAFPLRGYLSNPDSPQQVAERMGADPVFVERVWNLADRLDGEADRRLAHAVLASDSSSSARTVATLVLGNFMDDDRSWHALVSSVIDPHPHHVVNAVARSMLEGMHEGMVMGRMTRQRDPVDWSGARSPLSAIFGGTNLPAFSTILQVLVVTGIEPQLAQQLARESPDLLLAYAGAEHGPTRIPALNFLRAMGGEDFGTDVDAWRAWIARISGRPFDR